MLHSELSLKKGNCLKIKSSNISESITICKAFGNSIKKVAVEFVEHEIGIMVDFVELHVSGKLEELELVHVKKTNARVSQTRKLHWFIRGLDQKFPYWRVLVIDYQLNLVSLLHKHASFTEARGNDHHWTRLPLRSFRCPETASW